MMTDRSRILILKERSDLIELELSLNDSMLMLMLLSKISSWYDFVSLLLDFIVLNRVFCHQRVERITVNIVSASGVHLFMNNQLNIHPHTEMELITQLAGKFAEEQGAFKLLVRPLKFSLDQGKNQTKYRILLSRLSILFSLYSGSFHHSHPFSSTSTHL
jgi:hypothetical protein